MEAALGLIRGTSDPLPRVFGCESCSRSEKVIVSLILIVCLSATPDICREERPPVEDVSATSCMLHDQQLASEWLDEHPKWALRGWRCKFGPRNNRADLGHGISLMNTRAEIMLALRDFRRDWRRWGAAERIGAVVCALLAVAVPTATFVVIPRF
jgi:hypothetical protein